MNVVKAYGHRDMTIQAAYMALYIKLKVTELPSVGPDTMQSKL